MLKSIVCLKRNRTAPELSCGQCVAGSRDRQRYFWVSGTPSPDGGRICHINLGVIISDF